MKNVIKPLAISVLIPLGLTAGASAADAGIHKKILGLCNTTLMISNDELKDIIRTVKYLEDSSLLFKEVSETIQNEAKEQRGGFLSMLLGTLGASLLGDILTGTGTNRAEKGVMEIKDKIIKTKCIFNAEIINEEKKYRRLNKSIRMMNSQRS